MCQQGCGARLQSGWGFSLVERVGGLNIMVLSHMPVYYYGEDFRMWSGENRDGVISLSGPDSFQDDGQMFAGVDV